MSTKTRGSFCAISSRNASRTLGDSCRSISPSSAMVFGSGFDTVATAGGKVCCNAMLSYSVSTAFSGCKRGKFVGQAERLPYTSVARSIAEIFKIQRDGEIFCAQKLDYRLQIIALFSRHADLS